MPQVILWSSSIQNLQKHILQEVADWQSKWPQKRSFLLVPETRKLMIEHAYLKTHKESSLLLTDVLSFSRLAQLFAEEMGLQQDHFLDETGKLFLLRRLLATLELENRVPQLAPLAHKIGFLHELAETLGEMHRCQLRGETILEKLGIAQPEETFSRALLQEIALVFAAYEAELERRNWMDTEAKLTFLERSLAQLVEMKEKGVSLKDLSFPLSRLAFLQDTSIWVFGFAEERNFTPQEWSILCSLGRLCPELWLSVLSNEMLFAEDADLSLDPYQAGKRVCQQFLHYFPAAKVQSIEERLDDSLPSKDYFLIQPVTLEDEVRLCCAELVRLHQIGVSWQDMGIVCANSDCMIPLRTAMHKLKIPMYIDERISLGNRPLIRYIVGLLNLAEQKFSRSSVCQFLRSGLVGLSDDSIDRLENFWLERGMTGGKIFQKSRYQLTWILQQNGESANDAAEDPEDGKTTVHWSKQGQFCWEQVEKYLQPCWDFWQEMGQMNANPQSHPCVHWVAKLTSFLREQKVEKYLQRSIDACVQRGETEAATAHLKSWQELGKLFSSMNVLLNDTAISLTFLFNTVEDVFRNRYSENLPAVLEQVMVGDLPKFLGLQKDYLYVLGADLSTFPVSSGKESFFTDELRKILAGLLDDAAKTMPLYQDSSVHLQVFYQEIFDHLFTKRLYFSGINGEARPDLVGLWQDRWQKITPATARLMEKDDIRLIFPDYDQMYRQAEIRVACPDEEKGREPQHLQLPPELMADLLQANIPSFSISKLEKYQACPYQYFVHYLLKVKARREWQPQSAELGTLLHKVLELYFAETLRMMQGEKIAFEEWLSRQPGKDTSEEERRRFAQTWIERAIDETAQHDGDKSLMVFREPGVYESVTRQARLRLALAMPDLLDDVLHHSTGLTMDFEHSFCLTSEQLLADLQEELGEGKASPAKFKIEGYIDRVDCQEVGKLRRVTIIDYKSNDGQTEKGLNGRRLHYNLSMQLPTYLTAYLTETATKGVQVVAADAGYISLQRKKSSAAYPEAKRKPLNTYTMKLLSAKVANDLAQQVRVLEEQQKFWNEKKKAKKTEKAELKALKAPFEKERKELQTEQKSTQKKLANARAKLVKEQTKAKVNAVKAAELLQEISATEEALDFLTARFNLLAQELVPLEKQVLAVDAELEEIEKHLQALNDQLNPQRNETERQAEAVGILPKTGDLSEAELAQLLRRTKYKIVDLVQNIFQGKMEAVPKTCDREKWPCQYCNLKGICQVENPYEHGTVLRKDNLDLLAERERQVDGGEQNDIHED